MKKIFIILTAVLSAFAISSCSEAELEQAEDITIRKVDLEIPASGGEASILYRSTSKVSVVPLSDWLYVGQQGDSLILLNATVNESLMARYGRIMVKAGQTSLTYTVQQYGQHTSGFAPEDLVLTASAYQTVLDYDFDETIVATSDVDWITLDITESTLTVNVAANTVQATKENRERTGKISWKLGFDTGVINVSQRNLSYMQLDANWAVTYDGMVSVSGSNKEAITNTVSTAGSGKYAITYVLKSDVTASGLSVADYLDVTLAPAAAVKLSSGELSLFEETATAHFNAFEAGTYYAVAIGFDEQFEATGHYAFSEFNRAATGASYEAWIGKWTWARGSNGSIVDTLTISKKEDGKTYTIIGVEGVTDYPLEAEYDSDTKSLLVKVQEGLGKWTTSKGVETDLGFFGAYTTATGGSSFYKKGTGDAYTIFTATLDGIDNASLTPGSRTTSSGTVTYQYAKYIGLGTSNTSMHNNSQAPPIPATWSRVGASNGGGNGDGNGGGNGGGNGDGNGGNQGSDAYKKFLGSWSVTPSSGNAWTAVFAANVVDQSYTVSNWEGWTYDWLSPMDANFKSDGTAVLMGGTGKAAATNVQVDDSGQSFSIYYLGMANGYVITSDTSMYEAALAIASDGNLTLTSAGNVTLNDGKSYPFTTICIVAMNSDMSSIYTYKNQLGPFPTTMTKASGTSVMTVPASLEQRLGKPVALDPSRIINCDFYEHPTAVVAE